MSTENWEKAQKFYQDGEVDKAIEVYKKLYLDNDYLAAIAIGAIYESLGNSDSMLSAIEWYEKAFNKGKDAKIALILGNINLFYFKEKNDGYEKAYKYYSIDTLSDNHIALLNLGRIFHNGWGVEQDINKAIELYSLSWKNGNSMAAMCLSSISKNKREWMKALYFRIAAIMKMLYHLLTGNKDEYLRDR